MIRDLIMEYLASQCTGREHACTKREIMDYVEMTDERLFRKVIRELRSDGFPILSRSRPPAGYYLPAVESEAIEALRELNNRAMSLLRIHKRLREGLAKEFPSFNLQIPLIEEYIDPLQPGSVFLPNTNPRPEKPSSA